MAFPLIALLTAAASDAQSNANEETARAQMGRNVRQRLLHTRAQQMGAQPYGAIESDYETSLGDLKRQAEASRNNNIGALLQAYLRQDPDKDKDKDKRGGGGGASGMPDEAQWSQMLAERPEDPWGYGLGKEVYGSPGGIVGRLGFNNGRGGGNDPWDRDPWGDAGY